jgi:hypothetical protein
MLSTGGDTLLGLGDASDLLPNNTVLYVSTVRHNRFFYISAATVILVVGSLMLAGASSVDRGRTASLVGAGFGVLCVTRQCR